MTPIEKALLTWYKPDNDKYLGPLHPTIKLAGEIGELLDLYAKHLFKPGFDWMECADCKCNEKQHTDDKIHNHMLIAIPYTCGHYTPKAIDELGDIWYYLRILAWQNEIEFEDYYAYAQDELSIIKSMYGYANMILHKLDTDTTIESLQEIYEHLLLLLEKLGYTIDQLTELNYQKLNSEETNHGWAKAQ